MLVRDTESAEGDLFFLDRGPENESAVTGLCASIETDERAVHV